MFSNILAPLLLYFQITPVTHSEGSFPVKPYSPDFRGNSLNAHANTSIGKRLPDNVQSFKHKMVVSFICFWEAVCEAKVYDKWLFPFVCLCYSKFQRVIIFCAL